MNVASGGGAQGTTSRAAGNVAGSAQPVNPPQGIYAGGTWHAAGTGVYNQALAAGMIPGAAGGGGGAAPPPIGIANMGFGQYGPAGMYTPTYARMGGMYGPSGGFTGGASAVVVSSAMAMAAGAMNIETQRIISGGSSSMIGDAAGNFGRGAGMIAGGIAGLLLGGGPLGAAIGAGAVGGMFESAARYLVAPGQARANAVENLTGFGAASGGSQVGFGTMTGRTMRIGEITSGINGNTPKFMQASEGQVASAWSTISGSLLEGGVNPFAAYGSRVYGPTAGDISSMERSIRGQTSPAGAWAGVSIMSMRMMGAGREQYGEAITRRMGDLFKNQLGDGAKLMAPVFGSLPETGGNMADMLMRFGVERTNLYNRLQSDDLRSPISSVQLSAVSGAVRSGARTAQMGALSIRGSGFASAIGYGQEMGALSGLPGGSDSLAYKQATRQLADSVTEGFAQSNMTSFGVPRAQIEGQQQRAQLLPYMPSRMFEIAGRGIALNNREIGALRSQMSTMESAGLLDESTQLQYTQRIESLRTSNASQLAMLSEGRENLLPGLVAGRRRSVGAVDSGQLAALSYSRAGLPFRGRGAINGGALAVQNAYADLVMGGGDVGPASRTSGINNMAGGGRTDDLLAAILATLKSGQSTQGQRPNALIGQAYGTTQTRDVGQGNTTVDRGSY